MAYVAEAFIHEADFSHTCGFVIGNCGRVRDFTNIDISERLINEKKIRVKIKL